MSRCGNSGGQEMGKGNKDPWLFQFRIKGWHFEQQEIAFLFAVSPVNNT